LPSVEVEHHRIESARVLAKQIGARSAQGFPTVTASKEGNCYLNSTGNPGMATAGSAMCSLELLPVYGRKEFGRRSRLCSVYLHGLSGDLLQENREQAFWQMILIDYLLPQCN